MRIRAGRVDKPRLSKSAKERNRLFFSKQSTQFLDLAGISGLDDEGDSRAFALLDYDRDGWQDIALINAHTPSFRLYRNQMGEIAVPKDLASGNFIALRFVGGNNRAQPSSLLSSRDGYGAQVTVLLRGRRESTDVQTLIREHRAGEGLAAQNSATMIVGIGAHTRADSLIVRWPSGRVQKVGPVQAGLLVTAFEAPEQHPAGRAFVFEPYRRVSKASLHDQVPDTRQKQLALATDIGKQKPAKLYMFTTMATWCAKCRGELPQLQRLRGQFSADQVGIYGVPVDKNDVAEKLKAYIAKYKPAYELLLNLSEDEVHSVKTLVTEELLMDALPATIITDVAGNVLKTMWSVPTVSDIQQLLADTD